MTKDKKIRFEINMYKFEDFVPFLDEMLQQGIEVKLLKGKSETYVIEL